MKLFYSVIAFILCSVVGQSEMMGQLTIKGTIYSEGLAIATVSAQGITGMEDVYLGPEKKVSRDGLDYYERKYEVPWRIEKGVDHVIKFTDGLVEKIVYISGVVPSGINPKQKFIIDIDLIEYENADMTLIVFWSMTSSSYKGLPLSKLDQIREEAHNDFYWADGSAPDSGEIRRSSY